MANYHQNPSYHQETAPPEHLYQNYGFSPAYDHQHRVPPNPPSEEYLQQPPTAPYPTLPPLQHHQPHQQQPVSTTHIHVQSAPVQLSQQPARIVYVQQQEDEPHCCLGLCCVCAECVCSLVSSVVGYVLAIVVIAAGIGLVVFFLKYYKH